MDIDEVDRNAHDCYKRLKEHFDSEAWRAKHQDKTIKRIVVHWVGEDVIKRPSYYINSGDKVELVQGNHEVKSLSGILTHYSFRVVSYETIAMRRYSCWCHGCLNCNGNLINDSSITGYGTTRTAVTKCRIAQCSNGWCERVSVTFSDSGGARRTRSMRYADGERMANDLAQRLAQMKTNAEKESVVFACATPEFSYNDAFELFRVAVPPGSAAVVRKLKAATTIAGTKFSKNRLIVFCRDLNRIDDDADRRTFVQDGDRMRAVEARMMRWDGVQLDDAGPAPRPAGSTGDPGRLLSLSEQLASDIISSCDV